MPHEKEEKLLLYRGYYIVYMLLTFQAGAHHARLWRAFSGGR